MEAALCIGTRHVGPKDEMVLRSMVKLLDGRLKARLRFADDASACDVMFTPMSSRGAGPSSCVTVRIHDEGAAQPATGDELAIVRPLRVSNVVDVLDAATARVAGRALAAGHGERLLALFDLLARHAARPGAPLLVPLGESHSLVLDAQRRTVRSTLALDALLASPPLIDAARFVEQLVPAPADGEVLELRSLLWALARRLAAARQLPRSVEGRHLLRRWPSADVLALPGCPRLCALLSRRPMTVAEAAAASGMPAPDVHWFIEYATALGLAAADASAGTPAGAPTVETAAAASRPLFSRIRERLKLW